MVVGAGVAGLSAAIRLLEDGWTVTVVAAASGDATTSAGRSDYPGESGPIATGR